jgi:hypothetical protein
VSESEREIQVSRALPTIYDWSSDLPVRWRREGARDARDKEGEICNRGKREDERQFMKEEAFEDK